MFTSSEASGFLVCQEHLHLCDSPKKIQRKSRCTACGKSGDRQANFKTAYLATISKGMTITIGDCLCRNCASAATDELAADLMRYLEHEDLICDQEESGMDVGGGGGGGEKEKEGRSGGRGGDDDYVTRHNLDDRESGDDSEDNASTQPSQGSQSQG